MKTIKKFAKLVKDKFSSNSRVIDPHTKDLYLAVNNGDVETVKLLLTMEVFDEANMALDIALDNGCLEIIYLLKDYCPNHPLAESLRGKSSNYFLCSAIQSGNITFTNHLITQEGADVYSVFDKGLNAFKIAAKNEDIEMMGYLQPYFTNHQCYFEDV